MHKQQKYHAVKELVDRWNAGKLDIPREKLNQVAKLAYEHGIEFDPESRPISKGLFDLVDTAAFGMVPNTWRPESAGEKYFGESGIDKFAGGVGTVGGLLPAGLGLLKGAKWAGSAIGGMNVNPYGLAGSLARGAGETAAQMGNAGNRLKTAVAAMKESQAVARSKEIARKVHKASPTNFDDILDFSNLGL
tara:strand:+ start:3696 stop:4268 length:573 start_codon:yes stop_codon:yes gene_type:complete